MFSKKGFKGATNPIDFVISIVIVVIIIAAVAIPTIQDVLDDANITGVPNTIHRSWFKPYISMPITV